MWRFYSPTPALPHSIGTSLPTSPKDGDEFILVDSVTAPTYSWLLRYVAAKSSNKWVFIGGASAVNAVSTAEATSSTAYAALTTPGPSFAIPVAGDYSVRTGWRMSASGGAVVGLMSYDIGGTGAVDADAVWAEVTASNAPRVSAYREVKKTGLTVVTLTAKYRTGSATSATFAERVLSVQPVAIGG